MWRHGMGAHLLVVRGPVRLRLLQQRAELVLQLLGTQRGLLRLLLQPPHGQGRVGSGAQVLARGKTECWSSIKTKMYFSRMTASGVAPRSWQGRGALGRSYYMKSILMIRPGPGIGGGGGGPGDEWLFACACGTQSVHRAPGGCHVGVSNRCCLGFALACAIAVSLMQPCGALDYTTPRDTGMLVPKYADMDVDMTGGLTLSAMVSDAFSLSSCAVRFSATASRVSALRTLYCSCRTCSRSSCAVRQ